MRSIYFESLPPDVQLLKDKRRSGQTVMGAGVFGSEVLRALLKYSSYGQILAPGMPSQTDDASGGISTGLCAGGRLCFVAEHQLANLQDADPLVLFSPGSNFTNLLRVRSVTRRPEAPITAVIHSIHYSSQLLKALGIAISPLRNCDALICSSHAGRSALLKFFDVLRARLEAAQLPIPTPEIEFPVIPLGVDVSSFSADDDTNAAQKLALDPNAAVILYFGRFSATSKADLLPLIGVFADLSPTRPAVLVLAGDDTHFRIAADLRSFACDLGCGNAVRVLPNPTTQEKLDLYARADIFVSPADSVQETFGITIAEAMAAGLPVVASDWNGYRELVDHGVTGLLIPTILPCYPDRFNALRGSGVMKEPDLLAASTTVDLKALAQALLQLLENAELRRNMGNAGRQRARTMFDWPVIVSQYEELWAALIAKAKPANSAVGLDLSQWDYREIFGHYPTAFMGSNVSLRITNRGRRWRGQHHLMQQMALPASWFNVATLESLLDLCEASDAVTMSEFAQALGRFDEDSQIQQLSHVCRLFKFGLVELLEGRTS